MTGATSPEPLFGINKNLMLVIVVIAGVIALAYFGWVFIALGLIILFFMVNGWSGGSSSSRGYHRLVAWAESNTAAKFDGSQPAEEVGQHLKAKLDELETQGMDLKQLAGLKAFIESRSYNKLIKK